MIITMKHQMMPDGLRRTVGSAFGKRYSFLGHLTKKEVTNLLKKYRYNWSKRR